MPPKARRGRGEGSIRFREDKQVWTAQLSLGFGTDGRRIRKTIYGQTKAEVTESLRKLQAEYDAGRLVESDDLTVGEYLARWLNGAKANVRATTWEGYNQLVTSYVAPIIGGLKLAKLGALHVEQLYGEMEKGGTDRKPASRNRARAAGTVLSIALNHAVRLRLIPANPVAAVKKPKPAHREMKYLTPDQTRALLDAAKSSPREHTLFALAVGTGARVGELLALTWADVDFDAGTLSIRRSLSREKNGAPVVTPTKTKASVRTVALPVLAREALRQHRTAALAAGLIAAPVFSTANGTHLRKRNVLRSFRAAVKRANAKELRRAGEGKRQPDLIPDGVRVHDLRHTHASCLIASGSSIKAVSRRLGHADIRVTLAVYAHLMPDDDAKLASQADALFG